jgi:hypothetical protein
MIAIFRIFSITVVPPKYLAYSPSGEVGRSSDLVIVRLYK